MHMEDIQDTAIPTAWLAVGAVIVLLFVGFWITGSIIGAIGFTILVCLMFNFLLGLDELKGDGEW